MPSSSCRPLSITHRSSCSSRSPPTKIFHINYSQNPPAGSFPLAKAERFVLIIEIAFRQSINRRAADGDGGRRKSGDEVGWKRRRWRFEERVSWSLWSKVRAFVLIFFPFFVLKEKVFIYQKLGAKLKGPTKTEARLRALIVAAVYYADYCLVRVNFSGTFPIFFSLSLSPPSLSESLRRLLSPSSYPSIFLFYFISQGVWTVRLAIANYLWYSSMWAWSVNAGKRLSSGVLCFWIVRFSPGGTANSISGKSLTNPRGFAWTRV